MAGRVVRRGKGNACRVLVRNPEGNRLTGRSRFRWEDAVIMDLQRSRI
jgi:hypothetical protein